jgi:hypothetical protein
MCYEGQTVDFESSANVTIALDKGLSGRSFQVLLHI